MITWNPLSGTYENLSADSDPDETVDASQGFRPGAQWITATDCHVCIDASIGAAKWLSQANKTINGESSYLVDLTTEGTFTRSTAAYYQTSASALSTAAINARAVEDVGGSEGALLSLERGWTQLLGNPREIVGGGWAVKGAACVVTLNIGAGPDGASLADRHVTTGGGGTSYSPYQSPGTLSVPYTASLYGRAHSGTSEWQPQVFRTTSLGTVHYDAALGETWERVQLMNDDAGGQLYLVCHEGRVLAGIPTAGISADVWTDFHNMVAGTYALRPTDITGSVGADTLVFSSWDSRLETDAWSVAIYPKWATTDLVSGDQRWIMSFDGANDGVRIRHDGTAPLVEVLDGGSVVMASDHIGTIAKNEEHRITIDLSAARVYHNDTGGAVGTAPDWGTPTNMRWGGVYGAASELDGRSGNPFLGSF